MADTSTDSSYHRVALDLAIKISDSAGLGAGVKKDEKYWLELYSHCRSVVLGKPPEEVLKSR